jgi:hypothetical protein
MENDHEDFSDVDGIEAYCMSCRAKTPMENPAPIWTRRGAPGTRGVCSVCGTTVFLMGKTEAHMRLKRPDPVQVSEGSTGRGRTRLPTAVTYVNFSVTDADFAEGLARDLNRIGIQTWLAERHVRDAQWATGVHPALVECKNMIVVLSPLGIKATNVEEALEFFVETGKPVFVVQLQPTELPDSLRRKPRFDFSGDNYRQPFRQLAEALIG